MTALAKMGFGTTSTVDNAIHFIRENITSVKEIINDPGFTGGYSHRAERSIFGPEIVSGSIEFKPSPEEAAKLLVLLGFTDTTGTFSLNDSALPSRYWAIDRKEKVFVYSGMVASRLVMTARKGMAWNWAIDFAGQQETIGNSGTFPAISITHTTPLALHHATLDILGSARSFDEITVTIDNAVESNTFNAAYQISNERQDRIITVDVTLPYNGNTDIGPGDVVGDEMVLAFTYGNYSSEWTFANVQFAPTQPETGGRSKQLIRLTGQARQVGTDKELVIVHDSTP